MSIGFTFSLILGCKGPVEERLASTTAPYNLSAVLALANSANPADRTSAARQIVRNRCASCHGFNFGTDAEWVTSGYVVSGLSGASRIFQRIKGNGLSGTPANMPASGTITDGEVAALRGWINRMPSVGPARNTFACDTGADPGPSPMQRLSKLQYTNTLRDVLVLSLTSSSTRDAIRSEYATALANVPGDESHDGYATMDATLSQAHIDAYFQVATAFASSVTQAGRVGSFVGTCWTDASTSNDSTCLNNFIASFGARVFRRPLTTAERNYYRTEVADSAPAGTNIASVVSVMLMSPNFLYRLEMGNPALAGRPGVYPLTEYETASRLSYLFWQSMPDQALFDDAAANRVTSNYATIVARVFADAKTKTASREFYSQWLELQKVPSLSNALVDPTYSAVATTTMGSTPSATAMNDLRTHMVDEVLDLAQFQTWERDGALGDLFTSDVSFAKNADLASLYEVPAWNGTSYASADLVHFAPGARAGVLTRAALLATGAGVTRPIISGVRIRRRLLCDTLSDPPPGADQTPPPVLEPLATNRRKIEVLTQTAGTTCIACHGSINPLGFGAEKYNSLGKRRDVETIYETNGTLRGTTAFDTETIPHINVEDDTTRSTDQVQLSALLAADGKTSACFARHYFRYAKGRREDTSRDGCSLEGIRQKASTSLRGTMMEVALQSEFRLRKSED